MFNLQGVLLQLDNTDLLIIIKMTKHLSTAPVLRPHIVVYTTVPYTEAFHAHSSSQRGLSQPCEISKEGPHIHFTDQDTEAQERSNNLPRLLTFKWQG